MGRTMKEEREESWRDDADQCGGCKRTFRASQLDSVLLDEQGNEASDVGYCKACWPRFKRVSWDRHTELE